MASHGRIVLSYHDTLLRESDVELLEEAHWVNDNVIWFWMQYIENELFASRCGAFAFVGPDVVQLVKLGAALNVDQVLKSLDLNQKALILLPVNDCQDFDLPGGCHWSFLVYNQARKIFEHYDSSKGHNHSHAKAIARALAPLLSLRKVRVTEADCLQQHNSFDCGLYVMYNLQQVCAEHISRAEDDGSPRTLLTSWMRHNRKTLKELILTLSKRETK
ncbi:sentrin-specific protease 8-like [Amblyomma americanum]